MAKFLTNLSRGALLKKYLTTGLPGGDRTPDPQLRRLMLYPTELRAVCVCRPGHGRVGGRRFRLVANHTFNRWPLASWQPGLAP